MTVLKKRRDFVAAARRGCKAVQPCLVLQARGRVPDSAAPPRVGYTASKRVGGAVVRNRAKRRLRAAADRILPEFGRPGWDYVLIARQHSTVSRPFTQLLSDLARALRRAHRQSSSPIQS